MKFPESKEKEYELVANPDTSMLIEYISKYIDMVLDRYEMDAHIHEYLRKVLTDDIIVARRRFLDGNENDYKFSTYFSWYIHKLLEDRNDITRKPGI